MISFVNFDKSVYIKIALAYDRLNLSYFAQLFGFEISRTKPLGVDKIDIFDFLFSERIENQNSRFSVPNPIDF